MKPEREVWEACARSRRPRCAVIRLPVEVRYLGELCLPDVPLDQQVYVSGPDRETGVFAVHRDDAKAMQAWVAWYYTT